ncbi:hypothetical protein C8D93_1189 [Sinimarinibacterium flocculans]|uniref:Uncharacterized protein n=1 Tax=Sinimarinibacterium flocculans TaxID=985250 RepID=A0A318E178_9GAMM|nr:hypothetical protein C8D93_1189 [Sinimarinibacterium flocculans]
MPHTVFDVGLSPHFKVGCAGGPRAAGTNTDHSGSEPTSTRTPGPIVVDSVTFLM